MSALSCIVCSEALENVHIGDEENQPYKGTCFFTYGHYGSTAFDPMDGTMLELNICDDCLRVAIDAGGFIRKRDRSHD